MTLCGLLSDSDFHYADVLSKEFCFIVAQPPCSCDSIQRQVELTGSLITKIFEAEVAGVCNCPISFVALNELNYVKPGWLEWC